VVSRSGFMKLIAMLMLFAIVAVSCGDDDTTSGSDTDSADGGDKLRVALLLPGVRNDNSFSQAAFEGLMAAAATDGNIETQILEEIIDPTDSLPALRDFANQGFDLILGHGIEYVDPIQQLYDEFPDVSFGMTGGVLDPGAVTAGNLVDWLYNVQDMAYPNGILAGHAVVGTTVGIVGGPEFDFVKTMHLSFRQAALSVNPDLEFLEGFAGSFVDVQKAAEVTQQLIDQGAEYIYCSGDGICIGAAQTAAAAGIPISVGFGTQEQTAPDVFLSATLIRMEQQYLTFFDLVRDGSFGTADGAVHANGEEGYVFFPAGIFNGQVEVLPVNTAATVGTAAPIAELQAALDELVGSIQSGEFEIPFPG
jgi:basic membrane protein A and related proteins